MERWEAIVERPLEQCHRSFEKVLETASALLNTSSTQLAPFETEWLVQTLLYSPVEVLATVSRRRGEDAWRKAVADALRVLARVADVCEHRHYEHIVDVCLLGYEPELRKHALGGLAAVARVSAAGARAAAAHARALQDAAHCRAPLALLVGVLCEYHPADVCEEVTHVWRGYLNMLENTKITDAVTKAALEGICGLLKNFGDDLPCAELAQFYDNLSNVYINKTGCPSVCYRILARHAALFKERVSTDRALRLLLWGAAPEATLLSVYTVTAQCVDRTALVKILATEVLPHTQSPSYQTKLAALRVLAATNTGSFGDLSRYVDVHALEYELRREKVSHADAETVLWCVEYNLPSSERLLQAAILFYDNLPPAVRKKIVAKGVQNSPPELKRAAIQFLIARSCENENAIVWRDIFDEDRVAASVTRELADCLVVALEAVEDDVQELPPKLCALLRVSSTVPAAHAGPLRACAPRLRGLAPHAAALAAAGTILVGACDSDYFYKSIRIDKCADEAARHAACRALVRAPRDVTVSTDSMLSALQIIFSSDVEPELHGAALKKFDDLLTNDTCLELDTRHAIRAVEKLRARGDRTDRDVRILHREVTIFLGKHGNLDKNNNRDSWDDGVIVDLKKSLALSLPCQGTTYKVDLKSVLLPTLQHEDPRALLTFLAMLCANLSSNKELNTQRAIMRVVCALAHAHASGGGAYTRHVQRAVRMCGDEADLLLYISSSKSCGARKLLAGALAALCAEPEVLRRTAERGRVMLASADSTTKRAGLDIAETLLNCLENNHSLSRTILPELIVLIAKTYETDTKSVFDTASKSFIDKKELFDKDTIRKTVNSLLENLLKTNLSDVKIYKITVKMTIEFIKYLRDVKLDDLIIEISKNDVNVNTLYVLAVMKSEFGFDSEMSRMILGRDNLAVTKSLLNLNLDEAGTEFFNVETVLRFLEEYCEVILELKYRETLQFIAELIAKFTPALVKQLHKNIKLCFTSLKRHWKDLPKAVTSSVQNWIEMLPIKKITDAIETENFLTEHHLCVEALKIISYVFDMRQINLSDVKVCMSKWPRAILKLHMSGRLEEYFFEEMSYFNDILTVSLMFLTLADVKKILKTNTGTFCGFFVEGFFEVLTEKPFVLLDEELKGCSVVLNDVVRLVVKKTSLKERYENVLELVDKLWPTYEQHATFVQKYCLLANLQCLQEAAESNPLQWATRVVCSKDAALEERVKLLAFLPEETFKSPEVSPAVCSLFPARLRELCPALLEAAAAAPGALLPTLAALAASEYILYCHRSPEVSPAVCSLFPARLRELCPALLEAAAAAPGALLPTLAALAASEYILYCHRSPEVSPAVCSLFPARLRELCPALLEAAAAAPGALLPTLAALAASEYILYCHRSPEVSPAVCSLFPARLRELCPALLEAAAAAPGALLPTLAALAASEYILYCHRSPEVSPAVCSLFPARLRELCPALLEAAAAAPGALLPTLAALAANDSSTGWWDVALESCLASVAKKNNLDICVTLFHKCHSERACERVLVPLLRHSSTEVCERFLASALDRVLGSLRKGPRGAKGDAAHVASQKHCEEYMISVHMLLIAFEKLPTSSLESPSSVLYGGSSVPPWHLVREACKLCHSLRASRCSDQQMYRKLQCMLYNCMCAAICRRRPPLPLYAELLAAAAVANIVDDQPLVLPIRASWTHRNKTLPVAVPLEPSTLSPSHTQRSRIFLRTLSEDPMLFDLHSTAEEVMEVQDICLRETPLNAHACAGTLTALLRHVAGAPSLASLWPALACRLRDASNNLKWLLAQIICNCKEDLKPQASVLLPGLLAVLASVEEGRSMNGLHVDVLDTILYWNEPITSDDLNVITHRLITTCMESHRTVFDGLLKTLYGWLELYGTRVEWTSFEKYYEDQQQDTQKALFQLIKTVLKTKIYIPQILSKIVAKLDTNPPKLAECFGLAIAACQDAGEKREALGEFKKYLEKCNVITNYVRVLYYSSLGAAECCGEQEFRKIADYVTKVTSSDRTKCLHVLSAYLSRGRRSGYVGDMFDTIHLAEMIDKDQAALSLVTNGLPLMSSALRRRCVAQVSALRPAAAAARRLAAAVMLQAYQELFTQPPQPPAKRQKTETTPILSVSRDDIYTNSVLTCLGMYAVDSDAEVARTARDGLGANLDKELGARFAECFLLMLYLPTHTDKTPDLCVCVSALLEMLFSGLRSAEGFKELRLRDEPLPDIQEADTRLLTLSKTFQGTFGSYSATRGRTRRAQGNPGATPGFDTTNAVIDVQMPIDSILETLLEFAKTTPEAARALLTEVLRSVLATSKFEVAPTLVPLLGTLLGREPTDLTPLYIDVARLLVGSDVQSLLAPAERLRTLAAGTEGAALAQLLYEDVALRCEGESLFLLGQPGDTQDVVMDETTSFSIEDLKSAFGKLSNWEDLMLQQRRAAKSSLPPLWTKRRDFVARLDSYEVADNAECWFDKMAAAFKRQSVDSWRWLLQADKWPRRHFQISAITEALSWRHESSEAPSQLFNTDCLAESAARLMIRSSYYASLQHSETDERINELSRSHELKWCVRANEMAIPGAVLQCVERNVEELSARETLAWLRQKLLALRQLALTREDNALLRDVLTKAEKYTPQFSSDPTVSIEMYQLMLELHTDLKSVSHHKLQTLLTEVDRLSQQVDWKTCSKEAVSSVFQTAMAYYDEALDTGSMESASALSSMCGAVCRAAAVGAPATDLLLGVLLTRLAGFPGQLGTERDKVDKLAHLLPTLDTFTLELLEKLSPKLPGLRPALAALPRASAHKLTRCLQLVCDPAHLITRCCEDLVHALREKDAARWKSTFDRMKGKIYENPYAGPSYKLLDKYKDDLYGIYEFEPTAEFASRAEAKLKAIIVSARREPPRTLRLSDLCPSLLGPLEDTGVEKLFGLQRVKIVKFYDKVQVFTDSIRRPVVLSMLLSTGHSCRALHKTGEPLARDAAAQRVAARCGRGAAYSVTLLDEQSALIEYLEGHERLRAMIASACDLDAAMAVLRPADCSLLESPAASLRAHHDLCARMPAHALRSAMEQTSSCVQDFISKKHKFTDSLADMTLLTWLLGLGDRHLQNIMCSRDGRVRSVDWGDVWRRAASPPARLTRNLLAVADMQVLEALLQAWLAAARGSALLLEACVRVAFHWMGPELDEQMQHVRGILRGTATSYDVTRDVTSRSSLKHKDKYLDLLDGALGDPRSASYSVEDQVSCLLRHCTAPALLSVARAGWEPWL